MQPTWAGDPAFRRVLRAAVTGFMIALLGVLGVFAGQTVANTFVENVGAVVALVGLAFTGVAVIVGFALGLRSLWRRTG